MKKSIYLDVCALSRPFDDQYYSRIRLETEAVNLVLTKIKERRYAMIVSPVHVKEIGDLDDPVERAELFELLDRYGVRSRAELATARMRAERLIEAGFGAADAAHVAFAEANGAVFISCDDKLLRKCRRARISVACMNPIAFCDMEDLQ